MTKNVLTKEGKQKLLDELHNLNTVEFNKALTNLADARDRGGIDENSEYTVAKEEYEKLQSRISKIRDMIDSSIVVSKADATTDSVSILSTVKVFNTKVGKEQEFTIVPENEIDIKQGKISANSPIGSGLLGKKANQVCSISTPGGLLEFKIIEIYLK